MSLSVQSRASGRDWRKVSMHLLYTRACALEEPVVLLILGTVKTLLLFASWSSCKRGLAPCDSVGVFRRIPPTTELSINFSFPLQHGAERNRSRQEGSAAVPCPRV